MQQGLAEAKKRFGSIEGVIHAAGVEGHGTILEKEYRDFQKVLAPKVTGSLMLDEILKEEPLRFICYFSSSAAILGDFGSCDYSMGNRFQMAYTRYRNQLVTQGKGVGKAIVINWPLWKEGGMSVGAQEQTQFYLKSSGQNFLEAREGLEIFDKILCEDGKQHLIIVGQPERVHRFLGLKEASLSLTKKKNFRSSVKPQKRRSFS